MTKCRVLAWTTDCALLLNNAKNVLFGQNQILDVVDLVLGAAVLGEQHLVASLDVHRHAPAVVVQAALADGQDGTFHRALFAGRVGQEDPALGLLFAVRRLDYDAVAERPNAKIICHNRCPFVVIERFLSGCYTDGAGSGRTGGACSPRWVQGVPISGSRKRSRPYQPATFQARIKTIPSISSTGLVLALPAIRKFQFSRTPKNAATPTNAPRIRATPIMNSPTATSGANQLEKPLSSMN